MSADTQLEVILNSVLKEVCMRGDFIHAEALKPAGNTCMVQGGACYNANANAADFHKASLNFHYPQFACMPGRVWKTQQTEWHSDVSVLPQPIFVRAELAKVTGLKACYAIPLTRQGHVVSVVVFYSRQVIPYKEDLEQTVFQLASDMLKDICQRFGQTQLRFVNNAKTAPTRMPRACASKVWESAKASLDVQVEERSEADVENIIKYSKRLPFFKYVSTTSREALCRCMQHVVLQEGEIAMQDGKDRDFVWFIVVKGRCDMMLRTEDTGKYYPMRAFEEGDTFAYSYLKMLTGDGNLHAQGDIRARVPNTTLVRVYVHEDHRSDFRPQTKPLLYEELAKYFSMSADQAADHLGLCMSAIKKICRRHGIIRWPHRKLLSANKSLALIDEKMMETVQSAQRQSMLRQEAISVLISKLRVMLNPTYLVNSELVQAQPSASGGQQVVGHVDDRFELEGSLSPNSDDDSSDDDSLMTAGGKRKKNSDGKGVGKDAKDKKSRDNESAQNKDAPMDSNSGHALLNVGDHLNGRLTWLKQESVVLEVHKDNGMLVPLPGIPMRNDNGNVLPGMMSMSGADAVSHLASPSLAQDDYRVAAVQAQQGGEAAVNVDMSIEYLSNMVRASLEKVPANVRDQVLSSVINRMHQPASSAHAAQLSASHPHATQRPQAFAPQMAGAAYSYMQMSCMAGMSGAMPAMPAMPAMHDLHEHHHYALQHQHMSAKQSMQANQLLHAMPTHGKMNRGAANQGQVRGKHAGGAAGFNHTTNRHADAASALNTCQNDESSEDEAAAPPPTSAAPSTSAWHHHNGHVPHAGGVGWNAGHQGQLDRLLHLQPAVAVPQLNQQVEDYRMQLRPPVSMAGTSGMGHDVQPYPTAHPTLSAAHTTLPLTLMSAFGPVNAAARNALAAGSAASVACHLTLGNGGVGGVGGVGGLGGSDANQCQQSLAPLPLTNYSSVQRNKTTGKGMELLGMLSAPPYSVDAANNKTLAGSGGSNGKGGAGIGGAAEVPGQQGGLWANIHLLCDLLGGPLGQVGKLTMTECDAKNKQEDNSSSK